VALKAVLDVVWLGLLAAIVRVVHVFQLAGNEEGSRCHDDRPAATTLMRVGKTTYFGISFAGCLMIQQRRQRDARALAAYGYSLIRREGSVLLDIRGSRMTFARRRGLAVESRRLP
jgi:hypothetical protein